jgi:hypothetical protein
MAEGGVRTLSDRDVSTTQHAYDSQKRQNRGKPWMDVHFTYISAVSGFLNVSSAIAAAQIELPTEI